MSHSVVDTPVWLSQPWNVRAWIQVRIIFLGDIPFWSFDPQIFHVGRPYSDLVPPSNFSIPIRVILGWDIPFWSFFLDIYSIVALVMELHLGRGFARHTAVARARVDKSPGPA